MQPSLAVKPTQSADLAIVETRENRPEQLLQTPLSTLDVRPANLSWRQGKTSFHQLVQLSNLGGEHLTA